MFCHESRRLTPMWFIYGDWQRDTSNSPFLAICPGWPTTRSSGLFLAGDRTELQRSCLRYRRNMTGLLEEALRRVESLSREEQDAIASQIMETLDDEETWTRSFREKPAVLRSLAR